MFYLPHQGEHQGNYQTFIRIIWIVIVMRVIRLIIIKCYTKYAICQIGSRESLWTSREWRSSRSDEFYEQDVFENIGKSTGKPQSSRPAIPSLKPQACNFIKKRLCHRCLSFAKVLRTPFLRNISVGYFSGRCIQI